MRRTDPEGHGPVRFGPSIPEDGLPVLPELSAVLAAAASRPGAEPVGGGSALLEAACGHGDRRGLPAAPDRVAVAPGAPALLVALTAAIGGDVLVPRPCAAWWAPYARLLGRPAFHVPTPAESGGVPDPYALLETVRRVRAEGGNPRLLVLSVADDPTATVAPPELLHETLEAAVGQGLHLISDETWRDTLHAPHDTVLLSPAEMLPERVTAVTDLAGSLLPPGWPAAVARFPAGEEGNALHARVLDVLTALDARIAAPVAAAAEYALSEPEP
ncbi:aminotransferase class I/II-fold pyridoxal phosphate-dependent enzyme, partial [Streptomyces viridosporus]|uniref:aminotransferase class I/II-fold pyridoxal phosphate-dependent enzyme n=1 Tax=Streptomyces viridosporus TaxID=67581 RepID=UPI0001AEF529